MIVLELIAGFLCALAVNVLADEIDAHLTRAARKRLERR